jgi:hypothetical protein
LYGMYESSIQSSYRRLVIRFGHPQNATKSPVLSPASSPRLKAGSLIER